MSLKTLFKQVSDYTRYAADVLSIIPSEAVKARLNEKGWTFEPLPDATAAALLEAPLVPFNMGFGIPLETVKTQEGVDLYKNGSPEDIQRYKADKKSAARLHYGL